MALTKGQARSVIRALMKDEDKQFWSDTALDVLTQTTLDELFSELLDQAPLLDSQIDVLSSLTSPGYIDLRTVAAGGALSQRLYRLQKVTRDNQEYSFAHVEDISMVSTSTSEITAPRFAYAQFGNLLYLFPLSITITQNLELRYSYLPPSFTSQLDGDTVQWPDGFESVFTFEAAARALLSQNADLAASYHALAEAAKTKMNAAISKQYPGPVMPHLYDTPITWGAI